MLIEVKDEVMGEMIVAVDFGQLDGRWLTGLVFLVLQNFSYFLSNGSLEIRVGLVRCTIIVRLVRMLIVIRWAIVIRMV